MLSFIENNFRERKAEVEDVLENFIRDPYLDEPSTTGSEIVEFLRGKYIFITGTTGFFGKILVEKLLRTVPDLAGIFVLARGKKGKDVHKRLDGIYSDPLYERLLRTFPKFRSKISPIEGDVTFDGLGINDVDRKLIIDNVAIIFHVAATVNFEEPLKMATNVNVKGTKEMLSLAKECKCLESFLHVSTAYANCHYEYVEEQLYEVPIRCDNLLALVDELSDEQLKALQPTLMKKWPNTYSFTKAIAESAVQEFGKDLPISIFRPAIVISSYREPVKGWTDNMYGPVGVSIGACVGLLRVSLGDGYKLGNVVPVDYVINGMIACAYDTAVKRPKIVENIPVYNYVLSEKNPITWERYAQMTIKSCKLIPPTTAVWYPSYRIARNAYSFAIYTFILHTIPALLFDLGATIIGKKPKFRKTYEKIYKFSKVVSYFTTCEWKFPNDNVQNLWKRTSAIDQTLFPFNTEDIDWIEYFKFYTMGIRTYYLKEDMATVREAIAKKKKFLALHVLYKLLVLLLIVYILLKLFM